jgi:hypothetical protein
LIYEISSQFKYFWPFSELDVSKEEQNTAEKRSVRSSVKVIPQSRFGPVRADAYPADHTALTPEPFVTSQEAAVFLRLSVRRVLEMARSGQLPAHPLGNGKRHTWRFRLGELADALLSDNSAENSGTILAGSPSGPGQEK